MPVHHAPSQPLSATASALPALARALPLPDGLAADVATPVSVSIASAKTVAAVLRQDACRQRQSDHNREAENSPHRITSATESSNQDSIVSVYGFQHDSMMLVAPQRKACAGGRDFAQNLRDFWGFSPDAELQGEIPQ